MTDYPHVVTPATARRLVAAGVDAPSMLVWSQYEGGWMLLIRSHCDQLVLADALPAPIAPELMEWMWGRQSCSLRYYKNRTWTATKAGYGPCQGKDTDHPDNSAEAVAALILEGHDG